MRQLFFDVGVRCYTLLVVERGVHVLAGSTGGLLGLGESQSVSQGIEELVERSQSRSNL